MWRVDAGAELAHGSTPVRSESTFDHAPVIAIWELTRACDLACRHCRAGAMPRPDPAELSSAEGLELIDQLQELGPGFVVLTGGDPLKRPDLFVLVEEAVRKGLTMAITPSVTPLLTPEAIVRLGKSGIRRIALSLDGPEAAIHDGLRGTRGAYAATLRAAGDVRAAGIPLQINTSITRQTVGSLQRMSDLVAVLAPALWSVFFVVPVGRASVEQQLNAQACEAVFHFLYAWSARTGLQVKTTAAPAYRRVVLQAQQQERRRDHVHRPHPLAVNDGKGFIFISHTGEVYPSGFLPLSAGNVRHTPLSDIYRTSPFVQALRNPDRLEGKCGYCEYRTVCGGSRARAFAATGNPFAEDPACLYQPRQPRRPQSPG